MNKKAFGLAVLLFTSALLSLWTTQAEANAHGTIKLMIDGSYEEPEVPARISNGRTFVPLRFISEKMGTDVAWDSATSRIDITRAGTKLELTLGSKQIKVNGKVHEVDIAPFAENGRTLVPIRFVSEYLGLTVGWEPQERLVIVSKPTQLFVNGQAYSKKYEPIRVNNTLYFPIFALAKQLNVEVIEDLSLHKYSFVYQVEANSTDSTYSYPAEEKSDTEKAADKIAALHAYISKQRLEVEQANNDAEENKDQSNESTDGQVLDNDIKAVKTISTELPISEIVTIDGVKMVKFEWVDRLLGTTSTWNNRLNKVQMASVSTRLNQLNKVQFKNGVFSLNQTEIDISDFKHFYLASPHRLVIDLPQTMVGEGLLPNHGAERVIPVGSDIVEKIRIGQFSLSPMTVRVVFDLKSRAEADFKVDGQNLNLTIKKSKPLVVIDPGHGGKDPGAVGKTSTEADIVLQISLKIMALLEQDPDFDLLTTRKDNTFLTLDERVEFANQAGASLFLSVHANAINRPTVGGTETFIFYEADPTFGRIIHKHLIAATGLTDRGLKQAGFRVLRGTDMPSVLIEIAFMSNLKEERLLNDQAFQNKVARAMYRAIREYEFGK
jgi:N-acetylmuramoyl-L-alanine amidase